MLRYFACLMLLLSACGEPLTDAGQVRVRSEVRLDGVTELFARSAGDVVIESVLMHAPAARVEDGGNTLDLLDDHSTKDALVFRYAPGSQDQAEERVWPLGDCSSGAELFFDFAPLQTSDTKSLSPLLEEHTIVIQGYLYVDADSIQSRSFGEKEHSVQAHSHEDQRFGSDPDTMPTEDDKFGSDPDTMPTEDDKFGSDPDTMPTDTMPTDSDEESSDPDTMPTERDLPDEDEKFGSDPDTMPTEDDKFGSDPDTMPTHNNSILPIAAVKGKAQNGRRVGLPFTMTFDGEFQVQKPLHSLETLDEQDSLLLDLYLNVNELFNQNQVQELEEAVLSGQSMLTFSDAVIGEVFRLGAPEMTVPLRPKAASRISGLREAERNR